MGKIQGCTVSWIGSQELTPQRSVAHQEPHIRRSAGTIASKSLIFNKSESATEHVHSNNFHGNWVEMYIMPRLLGIVSLSGKFGCLCGKWSRIGPFFASSNEGSRCRSSSSAAFADSTNISALAFMVFIIWALHPLLYRNVMDAHSSGVFSGPGGPFVSFIKVWIYCVSEVGRKRPILFLCSKQTKPSDYPSHNFRQLRRALFKVVTVEVIHFSTLLSRIQSESSS